MYVLEAKLSLSAFLRMYVLEGEKNYSSDLEKGFKKHENVQVSFGGKHIYVVFLLGLHHDFI